MSRIPGEQNGLKDKPPRESPMPLLLLLLAGDTVAASSNKNNSAPPVTPTPWPEQFHGVVLTNLT
uniref:Uncharacterized protein n=1 Tax=Leersia perrieri TaxID=77586 RepID=A0A0D9WWD7_9ORYZ